MNFPQQLSRLASGAALRKITLALFLVIFGASAALAQTKAYVTSFDNTVRVIDTTTNAVIATVPVGAETYGIALTPNNAFAYVANEDDNTVSVIDTATNTVIATVPVGPSPKLVAITPNGSFAYVTTAPNTVTVISTATNTVVATVTVGLFPEGIAITPNGAFIYVANGFSSSVSVINATNNTVVATIPDSESAPDQIASRRMGPSPM
jgi:YVTN family beta-propeller protein